MGKSIQQRNNRSNNKNIHQFNDDIKNNGSYLYRSDACLSAQLACRRISRHIAENINFSGKNILDIGCGDGNYTLEIFHLGAKEILGLDPAEASIAAAKIRANKQKADSVVKFALGDIYNIDPYINANKFDYIMLWGVLHHLPDPARAIANLSSFKGKVVIIEPNGNNPVVKIIEKLSSYHIEHDERSFTPMLIRSWLTAAGFQIDTCKMMNLVPMFCPNWMAKFFDIATPLGEQIPLLRNIICGQTLIIASR